MAPSIDTERCWSDRIGSMFDQAIERLWFAEGKEMRRTVLEQAHQLALEQLGIWEEYRQWNEKRREIERLQAEYVELEQRMWNIAESHAGPFEHHSRNIDSIVGWKSKLAEREILRKHEFGRNVLRLKDERDNLFETILMAQTEEMMESVWIAVQAMLGEGLTPLQELVLKLRRKREDAKSRVESI